jgi:hypothetical protein
VPVHQFIKFNRVFTLKEGKNMAKIPTACQKIKDKIKSLQDQVKKIKSSPGFIQGKDDPHPGKPDPIDLAEVKKLQAEINALNSAFNDCLVKNVAPFPIRIAVSSIHCLEEQEGGILQDDEPYVMVAGIDLAAVPIPNLEVTLYGPFEDVNTGEGRNASGPPFWALDNKVAKTIAKPSDVIFIVAFLENDDGNPKALRTLVKSELMASLVASNGMSRATRVNKLIADMGSALGTPTGFPDSDDQIGSAQELKLTSLDLVRPILGAHVKKLTFSGDGAKYEVSCALTAA